MLSLQIVSPTEVVFDDKVDFVVIPGVEGQLGILSRHTPLLSALKKGEVTLRQKEAVKTFDILGGFVEVLKNKVTVLTK